MMSAAALTVIDLIDGDRRRLWPSEADERLLAQAQDAIGAQGEIGNWRVRFLPMMLDGSHAFELWRGKQRVSVGFVGATATNEAMMWVNALDYAPMSIQPPDTLPWLAVAVCEEAGVIGDDPDMRQERQEIERSVAWAILQGDPFRELPAPWRAARADIEMSVGL